MPFGGLFPLPVPLRNKTLGAYALLVFAALGGFLVIRAHGVTLEAPEAPPAPEATVAAPLDNVFLHVLISLLVVMLVARGLGALFRHLQQPPVIGEVLAGIVLGPSLLGRLSPGLQAFLLPEQLAPQLGLISHIGILLFMFLLGLELDTSMLGKQSRMTLTISHASMLLPFLAGAALSLWLYPRVSTQAVGFTDFALFIGVSLSVTALPVLARLLADRGMERSELGALALRCAAVDHVTGWCLLALMVGLARAGSGAALLSIALTITYVLVVLLALRPVVRRLVEREQLRNRSSQTATAAALMGLFTSAMITEAIGVHALFGAFLFGAIIPHDSLLARDLNQRLRDLIIVLFLPAFFAFTGLRLQLGLLESASDALCCLAIVVVACAGKFGGSALAARAYGVHWRDASALGVLMNTRGLMELIVLHVGLDLGLISPRLFAMLVIMVVATTLATSPLLSLLRPAGGSSPDLAAARGT